LSFFENFGSPITIPGGVGGTTYGGPLSPFQGGSAGGFGYDGLSNGGRGGGAIEIGALGNLSLLNTTIHANGADGALAAGGGSGGSISLLGNTVDISAGSYLWAVGGSGGAGISYGGIEGADIGGGGGGGGGIIDIQANSFISNGSYNLSGGSGVGGGSNGVLFLDPAVPEPSGIVLGSLAILTGLSYYLFRR